MSNLTVGEAHLESNTALNEKGNRSVRSPISKLAPWIAIVSLFVSSVLTSTHHHGSECGCEVIETATHGHPGVSPIAGLENLPLGDCDCTGCDTPEHQNELPSDDHDHDSCSVCRMICEHALESAEFSVFESNEPTFDSTYFFFQATKLDLVSRYLTRGPPAQLA